MQYALLIRLTSGNRLARYRINPLAAMGAFLTAVVGTFALITSPQPSSGYSKDLAVQHNLQVVVFVCGQPLLMLVALSDGLRSGSSDFYSFAAIMSGVNKHLIP